MIFNAESDGRSYISLIYRRTKLKRLMSKENAEQSKQVQCFTLKFLYNYRSRLFGELFDI